IGQIDNKISILKRILPKVGTTSIDKARREVLRDQLYMAVAHREIPSEQRIRAVNMLKEFFDADDVNMVGRLFVVHVETQRTPKYPIVPKENKVQSPQGNPIEVYEILESEADIDAVAETASMSTGGEPFDLSDSGPSFEVTSEKTSEHKEANNVLREPVVSTLESTKQTIVQIVESEPVFIGKDPLGNDITWDSTKNPNFGIMVTGDPGYGKTQTIRALMSELRKKGYPVLVFDFKNDYSDNDFVKELNLKVYDIVENGLPFNPLTLLPNETGMVQPIRQCHDLTSIIARVEGLKEQQQYRLVEAMKRSYEKHGIDPKAKVRPEEISSEPIFDEVLEELANDDDVAKTVLYRLQKFSDLGLFPTTKQEVNFDELIQDGVVLTMNDEANAPLMQILAEIMIVKLHALVKRGDQPRALKRLLVFDEAWRIAKSQRLVELAREGRSFGLGIIVGTQKPKDIPENLMSCLRTQIYLFNNEPDDQKIILKSLCNTTSGSTAERLLRVIKGFGKFEGYISSAQYQQGVRVNIVPHYDRS
ncbi:MAG: type IV secretion system DNA-binding domain-containing protein, partial [Rectinemataceae bacterium]|nr:type IV secretion system DNA-binding domain-containing protein [Rectinemataceae bacterium]